MMLDGAILVIAAFLAGLLNAIAGGGSFLTFPALVFVGVPPIAANATSAVAVFPGYLSSAFGFRKQLVGLQRSELAGYILLSITGGIAGALLLLVTPSELFEWIVPWLLLLATLLFAFDKSLRKLTARSGSGENGRSVGRTLATLLVTTYGGYFNGGLGIVLLALFSGLGMRDIQLMNGMKNMLSFILSAASVATFAIAGIVHWPEAVLMMIAASFGGYTGAHLAQRMPVSVIRSLVIMVGFAMTLVFFVR